MAALTTRQDQRSRWRAVWTYVFAAGLLLPVGWNIVADRIDLERRASQLEKDFPLLRGKDVIYSSMGELPLRAGFRPFSALENVPPLVFMGSMYLLPQVVEGERLRGCGGFVDCLASGTTLNLVASDDDVKRLDTLLREHYGKTLTTLTRTSTPSFTLHVIAAKDS